MGDPTATQVKFKSSPNLTSTVAGGGIENDGGTLRTKIHHNDEGHFKLHH